MDVFGLTEGPLIDGVKDFSKDPNPTGRDEMGVDWSDTKAPKDADVVTPQDH